MQFGPEDSDFRRNHDAPLAAGFQRLSQTRTFEVTYGGGEANVAISLANLGLDVDFVTR